MLMFFNNIYGAQNKNKQHSLYTYKYKDHWYFRILKLVVYWIYLENAELTNLLTVEGITKILSH